MKRNILIFALCALMDVAALGQTTCPVKITYVSNIRDYFTILFQNSSGADITGYVFVVWFVDLEGRTHFVQDTSPGNVARVVKPGKGAIVKYPAPETLEFAFTMANAYVLHAEFADGSVWNDDGSHACRVATLQE